MGSLNCQRDTKGESLKGNCPDNKERLGTGFLCCFDGFRGRSQTIWTARRGRGRGSEGRGLIC